MQVELLVVYWKMLIEKKEFTAHSSKCFKGEASSNHIFSFAAVMGYWPNAKHPQKLFTHPLLFSAEQRRKKKLTGGS